MQYKIISKSNFDSFVSALINAKRVVGPKKKSVRFVYDEIEQVSELRLDFDTTVLPPKKFFFPPKQDLVKFDENSYQGCIDPVETIILGVHPYDIAGINQLDQIFSDGHPDQNYLAYREATTIIGSNVLNVNQSAFFGSIGTGVVEKGYDMFLTDIEDAYLVEIATDKGEALLEYGEFEDAQDRDVKYQERKANEAIQACVEKIEQPIKKWEAAVRDSFENGIWEVMAKKCFSCGSCNLVCPTCYCFDVQDVWNIDQKSGRRYRAWDGCQLPDFAVVTVQGGSENFRAKKHERYRHRAMRKLTYLNEKLNAPACVGCGRCTIACTADIANPVNIINRVLEVQHD